MVFLLLSLIATRFVPVGTAAAHEVAPATRVPVKLGVDVLLDSRVDLIAGKRVGLVTNASAVDGSLVPTLDRLRADPRVNLVQLYSPEHGLGGAMANGRSDHKGIDPDTGLPIEGLFGRNARPSPKSLARVDVLVFDIQDIGSRTYTYISTLGHVMIAAARARVPLIVLDRPNPNGGLVYEGPIREPKYRSLIGWGPLPVTHGMTVGELARFYNGELGIGCDLTVVPMENWRRGMYWDDTGLTWVPTSPGIPHALNAYLYVATGMVGGSGPNLNEGAGNSMPFELVGAPWVDARRLAEELNAAGLPGVYFRPLVWRAHRGQFANRLVRGVQLVLRDVKAFRPLKTALAILTTIQRLHPKELKIRDWRRFGRTWGNDEVLRLIRRGLSHEEIERTWAPELAAFGEKRAKYLIYPE